MAFQAHVTRAIVPMISALQVRPVLAAFDTLGLDASAALARAGIARESLDDAARLPADAEESPSGKRPSSSAATERSGCAWLTWSSRALLGSLDYLLRHSETPELLLTRAQRYGRVLDDLSEISWQCRDGVLVIRTGRQGGYPVPPAGVECLFAVVLAVARATWPGSQPLAVHFAHPAAADVALYRARFGCEVRFGAGANQFLWPEAWLHAPSRSADTTLGLLLEQQTSQQLAQLTCHENLVDRARHALLGCKSDSRSFGPHALARSLHLSERTLRRRLAEHGTSYQTLLDELRRTIALGRVVHEETSFEQLARGGRLLGPERILPRLQALDRLHTRQVPQRPATRPAKQSRLEPDPRRDPPPLPPVRPHVQAGVGAGLRLYPSLFRCLPSAELAVVGARLPSAVSIRCRNAGPAPDTPDTPCSAPPSCRPDPHADDGVARVAHVQLSR